MLLFITPVSVLITSCAFHFNTSHVTVYLDKIRKAVNTDRFQYISCYCLSRANRNECKVFEISIHLMLLFIHHRWSYLIHWIQFQYISCYCLSIFVSFFLHSIVISIHLMLLFIRLDKPIRKIQYHFNTSHVTVYPIESDTFMPGL